MPWIVIDTQSISRSTGHDVISSSAVGMFTCLEAAPVTQEAEIARRFAVMRNRVKVTSTLRVDHGMGSPYCGTE